MESCRRNVDTPEKLIAYLAQDHLDYRFATTLESQKESIYITLDTVITNFFSSISPFRVDCLENYYRTIEIFQSLFPQEFFDVKDFILKKEVKLGNILNKRSQLKSIPVRDWNNCSVAPLLNQPLF